MFEDSLFESQQHAVLLRSRWTAVVAFSFQVLIASLLLVVPLLHTALLPERQNELQVMMPLQLPPPPPPRTVSQRASSAIASVVPAIGRMLVAPRILPKSIDMTPMPEVASPSFVGMGNAMPLGVAPSVGDGAGSRVSVVPERVKPAGPVRVSAGVSAGLLLTPIRPIYPSIAKAAHVAGTVVVEATISKSGTIESLHVLSGPAMLQSAAVEAIRVARYQPFLLNGEATEVQTIVTVNFLMEG